MVRANERAGGQAAIDREKRLVAASSFVATVFLTAMKLVVGVASGSVGILSEAAHSALDLVAAGVTYLTVRVSGRPADRHHTYGHGKLENLSALVETVLLLATCAWIVWESAQRLFFTRVKVEVTAWAFAVMAVSIVVDISRSRALARAARRYDSQALQADALHFSTDIWSSAVVIIGLGLTLLADRLGAPWLANADAVAALGVAGIVVFVSLKLGRRSVDELLDAVPPGLTDDVARAARVEGVLDVKQVRVRRSGPVAFADVTLTVGREAAFERAHDIATAAEEAVKRVLGGADVVVHVEPVCSGHEGIRTTIRLLAARHGFGAHAIRIYEQPGRRRAELHIEVNEAFSLREAHEAASGFERLLRETVPGIDEVETHIDTTGDLGATFRPAVEDDAHVRDGLRAAFAEVGLPEGARNIMVQRANGETFVSFRFEMPGETPITDAHTMADRVERGLRARVPGLATVVIHVEPEGR